MVARLDRRDRRAGFFNDAGGLVAEHHRPHGDAPFPAHHMKIGAT